MTMFVPLMKSLSVSFLSLCHAKNWELGFHLHRRDAKTVSVPLLVRKQKKMVLVLDSGTEPVPHEVGKPSVQQCNSRDPMCMNVNIEQVFYANFTVSTQNDRPEDSG